MKKFKKLLSLILSLTLTLSSVSMITIGSASAEEDYSTWDVILDEDFEEYTSVNEAIKSGWQTYNYAENGSEMEIAEDANGKSFGIANFKAVSLLYDFDKTIKDGQVRITYKVNANKNSHAYIDFSDLGYVDGTSHHNLSFFYNDGKIYRKTVSDGSWTGSLGAFEVDAWTDVEIIMDIDAGTSTHIYKKADGTVLSENTFESKYKDGELAGQTVNAIKGFSFSTTGVSTEVDTHVYIDDVQILHKSDVEEVPTPEEDYSTWRTILDEDFESYTNLEAVKKSGWGSYGKNDNEEKVKVVSDTYGNAVAIVDNSVENGTSIWYDFDKLVTEGQLRITYKIKPSGSGQIGTHVIDSSRTGRSNTDYILHNTTLFYPDAKIWQINKAAWSSAFGNYSGNTWYNVELLYDLTGENIVEKQTITDMSGNKVGEYEVSPIYHPWNGDCKNGALESLGSFQFTLVNVNASGTGTSLIDDVLILHKSNAGGGALVTEELEDASAYEMSVDVTPVTGSNDVVEFEYADGVQDTIAKFADDGYIYVSRNGKTDEMYKAVAYETGKTYSLKAIANKDRGYYSVSVSADGEEIFYRNGIPMTSKYTGFETVSIYHSYEAASTAENAAVAVYTGEIDTVLMSEDFEQYTTVSGGTAGTDMFSNRWGTEFGADTWGTANLPVLDTTTFAGNKVLSFGNSSSAYYHFDDIAIADAGKIRLKTSMNFVDNGDYKNAYIELAHSNSWKALAAIVATYVDGDPTATAISTMLNDKTYTLVPKVEYGKWYDFNVILDYDKGLYNVQVSCEGKVVSQLRDLPMTLYFNSDNGIAEDFEYIRYRVSKGGLFMDNVSVEAIKAENDEDRVIIKNDFNGITDRNQAYKYYWSSYANKELIYETLDDAHGTSVNLTGRDKYLYAPIRALDSGKYKIKYSYYATGSPINVAFDTTDAMDISLVYVYSDGSMYHTYRGADAQVLMCEPGLNKWITVEHIIDLNARTNSYIVTDESGKVLAEDTVASFISRADYSVTSSGTISKLWLGSWGDGTCYFDDVEVSYYVEKPSLSAKDITMTDARGAKIEKIADGITPAISKITLNFGNEMNSDSLASGLSLTDENGNAVEFTGTVSGTEYVMTLSNVLKGETSYTLKVLAGVESLDGMKMDTEYSLTFKTGKGESKANLLSVTLDGTAVESVSALKAGDVLTVNTEFVNFGETAADAMWIIGYYNGKQFVGRDSVSAKVPAGALTVDPVEFTMPDLTDITDISVFLWDTNASMKPYCEQITIGQ